jgi:hypothetical protein
MYKKGGSGSDSARAPASVDQQRRARPVRAPAPGRLTSLMAKQDGLDVRARCRDQRTGRRSRTHPQHNIEC